MKSSLPVIAVLVLAGCGSGGSTGSSSLSTSNREEEPVLKVPTAHAWKDDAFKEFGGIVLHGDPLPKTAQLAGTMWKRTDAKAVLTGDVNYVAKVYTCDHDDRRLLVRSAPDDRQLFHAAEEEKVLVGGEEKWVRHGWSMVVLVAGGRPRFFFTRKHRGTTVEELGVYRMQDGQLVLQPKAKSQEPASSAD